MGRAFLEVFLKDQVSAGLAALQGKLRAISGVMRNIGSQLMGSGLAIGVPFAFAAMTLANFDDAMRAAGASVSATQGQLAGMTAVARELGTATGFGATAVGKLMTELGRAGFNPDEINAMTGAVLNMARATGTDATLSSGIMASAIRQFKLQATDATRIADVFTATANMTFNSVEQLGEALSYAGPVARDFGVSFEDTMAILGGLGNVGIQASNAGTALRRLLTLTGADAQKLQDIFGVAFMDSSGNARPLVQVLGEINQATAGLGTAARAAKFNEAFGLLGITASSVIGSSAADIAGLAETLKNVDGVAARTAAEMDAGLGGSFRRVMSMVQDVGISLGEALAPALQTVSVWVVNVGNHLKAFIEQNKSLIVTVASVIGAMVLVGGTLIGTGIALNLVSVAFGGLATVTGLVGTALGFLSPIAILTTAALWAKAAATTAATAALTLYSGAITVARIGLMGVYAASVVTQAGVSALRLGFLGLGAAATGLSIAAGAVRTAFAAASAGVATFRLVMVFTHDTTRAMIAAWRTFTAAIGASQVVIAAGVATIKLMQSALLGVRAGWFAMTAAIASARAALTLATIHQTAFSAGAAVLGGVEAVWRGITAAVATARAALTLANLHQVAFTAGAAVLGIVETIWRGITAAVATARAALTLANLHQVAFTAGAVVLGTVETIWRGITAAVAATRAMMTLAGIQQIAFAAGSAALAVVRGTWALITSVIYGTGAAMAFVRGISLTTSGAIALLSAVASGGAAAMSLLSAGLAMVQAAALGPIAPIIAVVAAVAGLGVLLYVNRETVFDSLGAALAGLGPTLRSMGLDFTKFSRGVSTWFKDVVGEATKSWKAISAAFAAGDLATAWKIAWNTMKVIYHQTVGPLRIEWLKFTSVLAAMIDSAVVSIRQTWSALNTFIATSTFTLLDTIHDHLEKIAQFDPTGATAKLAAMFDIDVEAINRGLVTDSAKFQRLLDLQLHNRNAARSSEFTRLLKEVRKEQDDALRELQEARGEDILGKKAAGQGIGGPKAGFGIDIKAGLTAKVQQQAEDFAKGKTAVTPKSISSEGSFSSAAAALSAFSAAGVGTAQDRTADATEEIAEKTGEVARNTEQTKFAVERMGTYG